jgi:hypothetical protein
MNRLHKCLVLTSLIAATAPAIALADASAMGVSQPALSSAPAALSSSPMYSLPYSFTEISRMSAGAPARYAALGGTASGAPEPESPALPAVLGRPARVQAGGSVAPWAAPAARWSTAAEGASPLEALTGPARWLMVLSGLAIAAFIAMRRSNPVD